MSSITSWNRLEPRTATSTLSGAQVRVADPLWFLARQWQLGELRGSDGGSAVHAVAHLEQGRLARYHPGRPGPAATAAARPLPTGPLEATVEAETGPGPATDGTVFAARAGQYFLRMLGPDLHARYRDGYVGRHPLALPPAVVLDTLGDASRRLLDLLAGRVPDGHDLRATLDAALRPVAGGGALPAQPPVRPEDADAVTTAARRWLDWYDRQRPAGRPSAWQPQRLEYSFAVSAARPTPAGEAVLVADGHPGGELDWYSFDVLDTGSLGGLLMLDKPINATALPTPARFPGMPNSRAWEFEDGATNLGAVDAAPDDLGRLLLLEFAFVYGNDFLLLPVDLLAGTLSWVTSLTVTTTFGDVVDVPPVEQADGGAGPWSMFRLSTDRLAGGTGRQDFLFLPPTLADSLHGPTLEEVALLRDEMANLAWTVEQRVQDAAGRSVVPREVAADRERREPAPAVQPDPAPTNPVLTYRLTTSVPPYWHALVPTIVNRQVAGVAFDNVVLEASGVSTPEGSLVRPLPAPFRLAEEELPRGGLLVTRAWRRARWVDGTVHTWVGRRKRAGRGEGYSGLAFDTLDGTTTT